MVYWKIPPKYLREKYLIDFKKTNERILNEKIARVGEKEGSTDVTSRILVLLFQDQAVAFSFKTKNRLTSPALGATVSSC